MSLDVYLRHRNKEQTDRYDQSADVWWANITHNMNKMADAIPVSTNDDRMEATLYDYVWRPEEQREKVDSIVMLRVLTEGINYMISHRKELLRFNPGNGWGSYDSFLKWLINYKEACEDHPGCDVYVSR